METGLHNENAFEKFKNIMKQDLLGVEIGIYSIAGLGLAIALRRIRPFTKFKDPVSIPRHFITKRLPQDGKVMRVEPAQYPLLLVDHRPPLYIPLLHSKGKGLPVKVLGVEITGNGISWLQAIVQKRDVTFVPLYTEPKCVSCIVTMTEKARKPKENPEVVNIGESLIRCGFARPLPEETILAKDPLYSKYRKTLLAAEAIARKKHMGIWQDYKSPSIFLSIVEFLARKIKVLLTPTKSAPRPYVTTTTLSKI